ncbi:two-component system OmpR family sensor kinase [Microbacterium resistens]|uniref:Sensor-like histidine kinase SenX3 n=1 Tax=Microbacterium resistens TaxID=156977 RepID=A0ABU1S955_9MICO|nr:HAMP domain-containing sensor histidine kinase [Microbacterium resistens]MDR6865803.1 two-component system OmpR family sensor kinase [Microbacterium resistens]
MTRTETPGAGGARTSAGPRRPPVWVWLLTAIPLVLGGAVAGALLAADDRRRLEIALPLPAAVLLAGLVLTALALLVVLSIALVGRRARRSLEERQRAVAEGAARERESHRRFLARLDHELKNPITAIRATAAAQGSETTQGSETDQGSETTQGAEEGRQPTASAWSAIDAQAARLSGLVRDLRKLADLETRELEYETVDLEPFLVDAIEALGQRDRAAGARTTLAVTRVPWPVPPLVVDLDLLSLAIDNVLGNAAKYSSGGPIEVRLREESGWAVIEVADQGRGIPAPDLLQVFDELARAHNARDVPGSGIGLTLVATVLRRHGGDVSVRSAEGSGSVFTLRLPLR